MNHAEVRQGDYVRVFDAGQPRLARVEAITAGGQLAQCAWTDRRAKHYVICMARSLVKVPAVSIDPREARTN